jgi:Zn-dependent protease with chaperone function
MEFEPKTIPEGINTSKEHPVREFLVLSAGISALVVIVVFCLAMASDYLVQFIPVEKESEWFSYEWIAESIETKEKAEEVEITEYELSKQRVEKYLLSLVDSFKDEEHQQYQFTINLIDDEIPNAFVTPGGHILVTQGLLRILTSENALAMVIGHEMGHQYHRHPLKSAGRGIVIAMGLMVLSGTDSSDLMQVFVGNTVSLTSMAFSRDQEREADTVGINLVIEKYHHASGASEFFKKIGKDPELDSNIPVFMSTHPGTEERIKFLEKFEREYTGERLPLPDFIDNYLELLDKEIKKNKAAGQCEDLESTTDPGVASCEP